jgi:hypothetical protein
MEFQNYVIETVQSNDLKDLMALYTSAANGQTSMEVTKDIYSKSKNSFRVRTH